MLCAFGRANLGKRLGLGGGLLGSAVLAARFALPVEAGRAAVRAARMAGKVSWRGNLIFRFGLGRASSRSVRRKIFIGVEGSSAWWVMEGSGQRR